MDTTGLTPSERFRNMIESAGWEVVELPEDITERQLFELAHDLVRKLDEFKAWQAKAQV